MLIIGPASVPHPTNSKRRTRAGSGLAHRGVCFGRLAGLLVGQEDVQHSLPAWLCGGTGVYLRSTMLPGLLAKCDIYPRAPVSVLRGGVKETSGRHVLRGGRETVLTKGGCHVTSGRHRQELSSLESHKCPHFQFDVLLLTLPTSCPISINTFIPSVLNRQSLIRSVSLISLPSPWA